jgi:ketosteroid isomerase-like protein
MDAQGTMRLMFDTMDAYDRADFDRLAEIYAEDAQWRNADPNGPHCHNRDDIFTMFRARMASGTRIGFDELRSTPATDRSVVAPCVAAMAARSSRLIKDGRQRSTVAALSASRSLSPITVAPELTGRGGRWVQVASRSKSRKKS